MRRKNQTFSYIFFFTLMQLLLLHLCRCNGSLLEGGSHHHHHHEGHDSAEHDHHLGTEDHNLHNQNEVSKTNNNRSPKSMSPMFNFLNKFEQLSKKKSRKQDRKGKKFKNASKRKEKKISRPFPFRIPRTSFSCKNRAPGYYADMEADCQVYRMCTARGGGQAFLCPEGTRFNQRTLVCDHQFRVSCAESSNFFHRNLIMHEESMAATKKAKTQNKGKNENLRKRPRFQSSSVIKINPRPNVIRTGRLNGRLSFAPLFEKRRKENFEKFAKALDMTSNSKSQNRSKQRINQLTRLSLPSKTRFGSLKNGQVKKVANASRKKNKENSRKNESKTLKSKHRENLKELEKSSQNKKNNENKSSNESSTIDQQVLRNQNRNEDNLLGLPELPPDVTRNSPIFTFKAGPNDFVFTGPKEDKISKENLEEQEEEIETIGGQLLPPVAAGKSVAKFHKDREGAHANNQLAVFLTPPPPVPKSSSPNNNAPLQLVGHVMTSNELSAFPDSPIVNIKQVNSKVGKSGKAINNFKGRQKKKDNSKRARNGRVSNKSKGRKRPRFEDDNHEEESRSSKGGHSVGLPIQLRPSARGMPAPLVWISPASLARSPMVSLRKLETPTHNELFRSGNVERALTMTFPGRSTGRFNPTCLECMSLKHNSDECPPCFLSVR